MFKQVTVNNKVKTVWIRISFFRPKFYRHLEPRDHWKACGFVLQLT